MRVAVDGRRVADQHQVEPAAAALAARRDADFAADALQALAVVGVGGRDLGVEFRGEWARADAGRVCLHHADDVGAGRRQRLGTETGKTGEDAAEAGVARGDVGVGAVVDVQEQGIGAFDEDVGRLVGRSVAVAVAVGRGRDDALVADGLSQQRGLVHDVALELLAETLQLLNLDFNVVSLQCGVAVELAVAGFQVAEASLPALLLVDQHPKRDATTGNFVTVARADALARGADDSLSTLDVLARVFGEAIDDTVQVEADLGAVGDEDAVADTLQAFGFEGAKFLEEARDVDDTARADQVELARRVDEAGWEDVEVVGDVVDDDGVARIVAAGGTSDHGGRGGEDVDELAFTLISPLGA